MAKSGWFYSLNGQPAGPYDATMLAGLASQGYVTAESMLWKEGLREWCKLQDIAELAAVLAAVAASPAMATAQDSEAAASAAPGPIGAGAAAAVNTAADPTDELAAFQAEISEIEAATAAAAAAEEAAAAEGAAEGLVGTDTAPGAGPATPDELEFEDDDGTWYMWDAALRKYVPKDDPEATAAAAAAASVAAAARAGAAAAAGPAGGGSATASAGGYDPELMTYVEEEEVVPTLAAARAAAEATARKEGKGGMSMEDRKRKSEAAIEGHKQKQAKKEETKAKRQQQRQSAAPARANTSVYVTGIPDDATEGEVADVFRKCGIIKEGPDKQPAIKLYRDKESGLLKGDALVKYLKPPSVALAMQILDGVPLRDVGPRMSVTEAKFEKKEGGGGSDTGGVQGQDQQAPGGRGGGGGGGGSGGGGRGGKGRGGKGRGGGGPLANLEKRLGWGGFDDMLPPEKVTVVLRNAFHPDEMMESGAADELQRDVQGEAAKLGPVERVTAFRNHPDGVVTVRFKTEEAAAACIARMAGRFFGGRQLQAAMWDGVTNFNVKRRETEEEQAARLDAFSRELEAQGAAQPSPVGAIEERQQQQEGSAAAMDGSS